MPTTVAAGSITWTEYSPAIAAGAETQDTMRIRLATGDNLDPMNCPHQFVGQCDACSASRQVVPAEQRDLQWNRDAAD
ncbi:hypothetical protein [Pseudarthrobacter sp. BIM B-2242]|uniref:hypothetical protein n=1 Tax=Pseudarthrobacter sp. BIM B-2242 TaxID=2772401 RepID=UPI00168B88EF|nr:hypothetical protein [Pseudarthrobacter sp. BIM B-2242]QOD02618.1 hypothetical protein IDT60_14840 [Pseudarthrobacter sp. BIM B-2242]